MDNLVTVRTYTNFKGWTVAYTYRLMKEGRISYTEIDGVKFVILTDSELKEIRSK